MVFITILLLGIIIGYPIWDYFYMKNGDFSNKRKMYTTLIIPQWTLVGILYFYWYMTNRNWNQLFIIESILPLQSENVKNFVIGVLSMIGVLILLLFFSKNLQGKVLKWVQEQTESIQFMLPITVKERLLFVFVAFTAGFCEEVIFRGGMLYVFEHLPFHLSPIMMILIAGVLFGIVHAYQGWKGILATGYLGGILFYIYIATGNLWICILIHFLVDIKFAFTPNKKDFFIEKNTEAKMINKQ